VLAGGRSTRFGRDKLAEPYRGAPLLHHPVLRLAEVCSEVVVVLAPHALEPSLPVGVPARVARDASEGEGPLAGLHAGLLVARTDVALVAAGDMPELSAAVLLEMVAVASETRMEAVALQDGEKIRPLPCAVRVARAREVAGALLASGSRRLRDLLATLRVSVIDEATWQALDPDRGTLVDVDEPRDLGRVPEGGPDAASPRSG